VLAVSYMGVQFVGYRLVQKLEISLCHQLKSLTYVQSRDIVVGIASGYGLDDQVGGGKNVHFSTSSRPALGSTQPPIQWVRGALSWGIKRQVREADHSPPASAEVKKMCIYTSTPP
jgi:hypothetical protein